jgi:hypothetical protein
MSDATKKWDQIKDTQQFLDIPVETTLSNLV